MQAIASECKQLSNRLASCHLFLALTGNSVWPICKLELDQSECKPLQFFDQGLKVKVAGKCTRQLDLENMDI